MFVCTVCVCRMITEYKVGKPRQLVCGLGEVYMNFPICVFLLSQYS